MASEGHVSLMMRSDKHEEERNRGSVSEADIPWFSSMSVRVCHLFMATNQVSPFRRHDKSMTSFCLSLPRAFNTDCRRSRENFPEGKRNDVMMT